ncbi:MAG: 2-amino-4-hydroxy-6-hydroxymethyldihydropteridine diphosphokinase [Enterobacterales bacterium]|nr:2-amino-4-hydroxy-6-hydroxymethyldihydropteridine diphosphokinase [Enterobacterales bacterium]
MSLTNELSQAKVVIGIGSNIDPENNILKARQVLQEAFPSIVFSSLFKCQAIGFSGDDFINLVAYFELGDILTLSSKTSTLNNQPIDMDHSCEQQMVGLLSKLLKSIESSLGRKKELQKFSARCIDIDILLLADACISQPVKLPRDEILDNAYVLWPLAELLPQMKHPEKQQTFAKLWQQFDCSKQKINLYESPSFKSGA